MLSVLREHEKPWLNPMLTEYREHATQEVIPGLFLKENATMAKVLVTATIENLADIFDSRRGRLVESEILRVEVPDALVLDEVFGLRMPPRLVEQLGLEPIPCSAVRLTIQGRECSMDVRVIGDDKPVMIGLIALGSMDWVIDVEGDKVIDNPEHGGEEMYDIFTSSIGTTFALLEQQ